MDTVALEISGRFCRVQSNIAGTAVLWGRQLLAPFSIRMLTLRYAHAHIWCLGCRRCGSVRVVLVTRLHGNAVLVCEDGPLLFICSGDHAAG